MRGSIPIIYLIVGAIVAQQYDYFVHLKTLSQIGSAFLAVVVRPLILLDVNLHVTMAKFGGPT